MKRTHDPGQEPPLFNRDPAQNANVADTSKAAAKAMRPKAKTFRDRILEMLLTSSDGMTVQSISTFTGIRLDTVKPRCNELWERGLAWPARRRKGDAGMTVQVWVHDSHIKSDEKRPPWQISKLTKLRAQIHSLGAEPCC